ncbi:hypothetical protein CHU93_13445 [Sandarakinorhabdus cyanobacteriorum]|uniref:DUF2239 domain-containing protein n=1 Tax=Sandarakinorhabdus cyanobacteriorum TaxID=1981098 RepID=A0A255YAK3_9SPHN|nr:DUF2239 family protein [Sandarakinorhabdus cyanobacteriorum]OYQ25724.1 hypothetical protein CHU93_13445 [Sandarakinorhabdus cyanobacteriorum]
MALTLSTRCSAFADGRSVAQGVLADVLPVLAAWPADQAAPLLFDDASGEQLDVDPRQPPPADLPPSRGRGRPKLGVTAREVTLLPRQWDWLARQRGGASAALRRLVDEARRQDAGRAARRAAQERCYRFLTAVAGDLPGYEEVIRALFAGDTATMAARLAGWPADVADHALALATPDPD